MADTPTAGPLDWIKLFAGIGGSALGAYGQAQSISADKDIAKQQLAQQNTQFNANLKQTQAQSGLAATQMNPFTQQISRQKQALLSSLMSNYQPVTLNQGKNGAPSTFSGGLNLDKSAFNSALPFFGEAPMKAAETAFANNARQASPTFNNNWSQAGYSGPGYGSTPPNQTYFQQNAPTQYNDLGGGGVKGSSVEDGSPDMTLPSVAGSDQPLDLEGMIIKGGTGPGGEFTGWEGRGPSIDPGVKAPQDPYTKGLTFDPSNGSYYNANPQDPNKQSSGMPTWLKTILGITGAIIPPIGIANSIINKGKGG